jgi:hypothetical protein
MLSTVLANPQSWNRYSYALNNPLRYVDPNGELWIASGDANNPYSWADECHKNQTCYESAAAAVGRNLRVYGSENAQAITNYAAKCQRSDKRCHSRRQCRCQFREHPDTRPGGKLSRTLAGGGIVQRRRGLWPEIS